MVQVDGELLPGPCGVPERSWVHAEGAVERRFAAQHNPATPICWMSASGSRYSGASDNPALIRLVPQLLRRGVVLTGTWRIASPTHKAARARARYSNAEKRREGFRNTARL